MTVNRILRRHYGLKHLDVRFRKHTRTPVYRLQDLERDLVRFPWVESISGHTIKPFVNYGEYEDQMQWFVMFRRPQERVLSHYGHQRRKGLVGDDFENWARNPNRRNWQVRAIAGCEDLEAAKQIIQEKRIVTGITENFDLSLSLLKGMVTDSDVSLQYRSPENTSNPETLQRRVQLHDTYRETIFEANELDIRLYDFVRSEMFPEAANDIRKQCVGYCRADFTESPRMRANLLFSRIFRNLVYQSCLALEDLKAKWVHP